MANQLNWITDSDLEFCVREVIVKGLQGIQKSKKDISRNSLDPFSALFDASLQNITLSEWLISEQRRQAQKTLQNALGHFHQSILSCVQDCYIPDENFVDLVNDNRQIVAEIKNKYNTVKGSNLKDVYEELNQAINGKTSKYRGYTAYYVTVIASKPERFTHPFTPSENASGTKKPLQERIIEIDGASFYELLSGDPDSLYQLYEALPKIIQKVLSEQTGSATKHSALIRDPLFAAIFAQTFSQ